MKLSLFAFVALAASASAFDSSPYVIPDGEAGMSASLSGETFTITLESGGGSAGDYVTGYAIEAAGGECGHGDPASNTGSWGDWYPIPTTGNWLTFGPATDGGDNTQWTLNIGPGVAAETCPADGFPVYSGPENNYCSGSRRLCSEPDCCTDTATVKMCIKASVSTGDYVVNFREMTLTIEYDLCAGFDAVKFQTKAYVPGNFDPEGAISFEVDASLCAGSGPLYNQGDEICIEICPDDEDADMVKVVEIHDMIVREKTNSAGPDDTFTVVEVDGDSGDLTTFNAAVGNCFQVKFWLPEVFFPWDDAENVLKTKAPECDGWATLQFIDESDRRLKDARALQQPQQAQFKTDLVLVSNPNSGSYVVEKVTATAALLGAAAAMVL